MQKENLFISNSNKLENVQFFLFSYFLKINILCGGEGKRIRTVETIPIKQGFIEDKKVSRKLLRGRRKRVWLRKIYGFLNNRKHGYFSLVL